MMPTKDTQQIAQLSALCTCDAIGMARRPSTTSSYVIAAPAARVGEKAEKFAEVAASKNLRIDGRVEIDLPGAGGAGGPVRVLSAGRPSCGGAHRPRARVHERQRAQWARARQFAEGAVEVRRRYCDEI